ncbi:hypothetical protein BC828DRAFT_371949 [Blastocladiella britannica]|nr:hypothetical protein BC828DRAFT_371949 [Blastocladiella britannica]
MNEQQQRKPARWVDPGEVPQHLKEKFQRRVLQAESSLQPPPWTRKLHAFSIVLSIGAGFYSVLYHDYGSHEHVFSPLRRWYFGKIRSFTTLSDTDVQELKSRGRPVE